MLTLLGSHNTPRTASSIDDCYAHFSINYIHSYEHIWYLHTGYPVEGKQQYVSIKKKKKNLFKEWMKKFIALLMKEKKTKNQWENNESGFLLALYSVYKKLGQFFFPYFTC